MMISESEVLEMVQTLGKRIVQNRKRLGLTQDALAERLGVTPQAVSKWENDQSCPDIAMLPKLAKIFGITTDSLLGLEPPPKEVEVMTEDVPGLHIDKKDNHWEFKWDGGRKGHVTVALWIICAALMLLAANYLNRDVNLWTALWTTGLTVFGLSGLWNKSGILRLGCGLAGIYFILGEFWPQMFVLEKRYILPIVLLLLGMSLLLNAVKKKKKPSFQFTSNGKDRGHHEYEAEEEEFHCELSFGSRNQLVELPSLKEGEAEVSFGELTLDLRGCREFAPDCHLDLECSFGNLTVLLPRSVHVKANSDTASGNLTIDGQPDPDAASVILVESEANFGEIILRYI